MKETQTQKIDRLEAALKEIKEIAEISDGGEFYAMLAEKALTAEPGE